MCSMNSVVVPKSSPVNLTSREAGAAMREPHNMQLVVAVTESFGESELQAAAAQS